MGFSLKLAPGVRVRVSKRGMRTSLGPRIARVHVGSGRAGVSTGLGPFGFYTSLLGRSPASRHGHSRARSGRQGRSGNSTAALSRKLEAARRAEARAAAHEEKQRLAGELAEQFRTILTLHREEFRGATPPVAPPPEIPTLSEVQARHLAAAMRGLGLFDRQRRRVARQSALAAAAAEYGAISAEAAGQQRAYQQDLDAWWNALTFNEPNVVLGVLASAFEDNEAAAAPVGVEGATAFVVVHVPGPEVVPDRMPTRTDAGNLSIRKLSKRDRSDYYTILVSAYLLLTAKETLAVAPGLKAVGMVAIRRGPVDPYGRCAAEPIMAARLERSRLAGIRWNDSDAVAILNAAATEKVFNQFGQAKELRPLSPDEHPDITRAMQIVDLNDDESEPDAGTADF
ncbi:DUF4236 domain-containing protein [Georgenia muralis]